MHVSCQSISTISNKNVIAQGNGIHSINAVHILEADMTNHSKYDLQALEKVLAKLRYAQHGNVADAAISLGISTASLQVLHDIKINWRWMCVV